MTFIDRLTGLIGLSARVLNVFQPLAALAGRLFVCEAFLRSGWLKISDWEQTLGLFENEYHVPVLSPLPAAVLATLGEIGFSILLILGLGGRAAAIGLFFVNAVAVISYPELSAAGFKDHILWGALLVVLAVYGPGRISADRAVGVE